ncbi:MAG: hypothetical protein J0G94_16535 [Sphingomonadales bacterium]|nr:hypothetical protein [Sphingomonadales bacterium]
MIRPTPILFALIPLAIAACAVTPEAQLRTGLVNAGLSKPMASCMARPMAERLSIGQLMKLRSLGKVKDLDPYNTSYDKFLRQVRALRDPQIVQVTASAALGCALG